LDKIAELTGSIALYSTLSPVSLVVGLLAAGSALFIALGLDMGKRKIFAILLASVYAFINLFWIVEFAFA
jgi:hypothetical protein